MKNKQTKKTFFILAGLILLSRFLYAKNRSKMNFDKFQPAVKEKLIFLSDSLKKTGLNDEQLKFAISQLLFETGKFTAKSSVAKNNNNYSGIKYINKPYQIATKGTRVPPSESVEPYNSPLNYYAKFDNSDMWAKDFVRILSLNNKPIAANNLIEYNERLAKNKYYDATTEQKKQNYLKGLQVFYKMIS